MKKYFIILIVFLNLLINISLGAGTYDPCINPSSQACLDSNPPEGDGSSPSGGGGASAPGGGSAGSTVNKMGIEMDSNCLINGQCKFYIYETLGIRKSLSRADRSNPTIFIQDVILSATFFVGTVITIVLIISGLLFVFAGANGGLAAKAKKGITGSLIGLLFVTGSYAFIRLLQFLLTGGGG